MFLRLAWRFILSTNGASQEHPIIELLRACPYGHFVVSPSKDLRVVTGTTGRDLGGGGRPTAPTTDAGEPFLIQKFIKSKGPHAFIIRQVYPFLHLNIWSKGVAIRQAISSDR